MLVREIALILSSGLFLYSLFPEYKTAAFASWPLLIGWCWLKWFFKSKLGIPFSLNLFGFLPSIAPFRDSIRYMLVHRTILLTLPLFALSFFLLTPSIPFWGAIWALSAIGQIPLPKKRRAPYQWDFSLETSLPVDPSYPLLRRTLAFKGEKMLKFPKREKPNVILIFMESFRAKNIGCLGGDPAASPQFDLLAKKGALFTQFYANGLQTYRAMVSSFFGIPAHLKTMSLEPFCKIPMIGLPEILKKEGYETALFQGSPSTFDWTVPFLRKAGFETILGAEDFPTHQKTSWGVHDELLFDRAAEWLQNQKKPAFLSLFTISNHHPWESPIPFPTPKGLPSTYERYLQTFAYSDQCLGQFIQKIDPNSIVFILGDHGQEMPAGRHSNLSDENVHIPLLILGGPKAIIDTPGSQVDLLPTLLDLLQIEATHHSVGRSLLREGSKPVFLSNPWEGGEMRSIPSQGQDLQSYFQAVEDLYARSAWAPAQFNPPSAIFSPSSEDEIFRLTKAEGFHIHECDLSKLSFLTDQELRSIATQCPNLSILNISGCPLITEDAIGFLLTQCSSLRSLNLEGHPSISHLPMDREIPLEALHLKNCPEIDGAALSEIMQKTPNLIYLSATFEKISDLHLSTFPNRRLNFLWLEKGPHVGKETMEAFLSQNPELTILILEKFPHIDNLPLKANRRLQEVKITTC